MSAFRGILTGFGMAAIKDKEAKDNAKMEVVKAAGLDYHTNQLPEHKKAEANRASAYNQLSSIFESEEAADYFDANGFITGDGKDVERIQKMLEDKGIKPNAFKDYVPTENYGERYKQRQTDFESRFDIVKKTFDMQGSGIGPSTIKGLLTKPEGDITTTEQVTTPAVEPQDMGPEEKGFMTEGTPERTETVTSTLPRTSSDSAMSEFFVSKIGSFNIGDESKIATSASSYRGFDQGIQRDASNNVIGFSMDGNKNIEYNAFKAVMNQVSGKYETDGKVSLSLAAEEANTVLYNQTQGTLQNSIVADYKAQGITEQSKQDKGTNTFTSSGFKDGFNSQFPSDQNKIDALKNHMDSLGTKSEAQYFARSFPVDITFVDGTNVKELLLQITR
tara:strand:+ start:493 stop:1662 length:1170 start_codon:yes stop_codon:yes gene_type:complete